LQLQYRRAGERCVAHDRHEGPLRVLQPLYPEGPGICHHVLVHPPGGIVGGDRLEIDVRLAAGSHALLTTPGATRFYRSGGRAATQAVRLIADPGARVEWLPLETLAFPGCDAASELRFELGEGAEMIGWDLLVLGLPASGQAFGQGSYRQHLEWPGRWLERATLAADDRLLLDRGPGLDGRPVVGTLWWARGAGPEAAAAAAVAPAADDASRLVEAARDLAGGGPLASHVGASAIGPGLVVLRLLADRVEPALALMRQVRGEWRTLRWGLPAEEPRVWRT
jgi:urease accessory protein